MVKTKCKHKHKLNQTNKKTTHYDRLDVVFNPIEINHPYLWFGIKYKSTIKTVIYPNLFKQ